MVIVLVLVLAILSTQASAHVGERVFSIPYVSADQLTLDGDLADWKDLFGEPMVTRTDFELSWHYDPPDEYDPANLDFRAWMAWSDHGKVYVAIEASDDVYRNTDDGRLSDHVALMVDGDHSGGEFVFFGDDPRNNSHAQYYEVKPYYSDRWGVGFPFVAGSDWVVEIPYAFGAGSVLDDETAFWTVEFYVTAFDRITQSDPDESEISEFEPDRVIGFVLGVFDWDHDDRGSGQFYLHDIPDEGEVVDVFADGILMGSDTAVESTTWARIKATLRP